MGEFGVKHHAVDRWVQRVDRRSTRAEAGAAILAFLAEADISPLPPEDFPVSLERLDQSCFYATSHIRPGVCVLIDPGMTTAGPTAVTVLVRTASGREPEGHRRSRASLRSRLAAGRSAARSRHERERSR